MTHPSRLARFFRGFAVFLAAVAIVTAACFAIALGYSLVICHSSSSDPVGWALVMVFLGLIVAPVLVLPYVGGIVLVAATLRSTWARFGGPRMIGALLLGFVALVGVTAALTALLGASGRCSIGF